MVNEALAWYFSWTLPLGRVLVAELDLGTHFLRLLDVNVLRVQSPWHPEPV